MIALKQEEKTLKNLMKIIIALNVKKTLCPVCEEHMYNGREERMCEYCDEDHCQICGDYISEGLHGLCRDCLSDAAQYYIEHCS